jgi:hypothetical protein
VALNNLFEDFKKRYPNLAEELERGMMRLPIRSLRTDVVEGEKTARRDYSGYTPDVIAYLRRCDTDDEAEAIISFLEARGEIRGEYAAKLRGQLKARGVRSFGSKKGSDYYLRSARMPSGPASR